MPFSRPNLTQIRAQAGADITSSVPGTDGLLRFTNLGVLGDLISKGVSALYGYLDWIAKQAVPFTSSDEYLEGWAALRSVTRKAATYAAGAGRFPATDGVTIPAGTPVNRSDGWTYVTSADATAAAGSVVCPLLAKTAGAGGNASAGAGLTLGVGIAGASATGSASTNLTGGADVETDDDLRTRMLQAYSAAPQGGASSDYVDWALEVPGITRAWCAPNALGAGTVVVYTMLDEAEAAHGGFPQGSDGVAATETRDAPATGDQLAVANAILPLQPVTALVYAVAPKANTLALAITLPGSSSAVRAQVAAAVAQVLLERGAPGGSVALSYIEAAVAAISGTAGFVITAITCDHGTVTPGSAGNIISNAGYLPVAGTITWS